MTKKTKAIALFSGGLDSILAVKVMLKQGIEVIGLTMSTPFCVCHAQGKSCSQSATERFDIRMRTVAGGEDYLEIVKNPKHGYGKNMNPCIDCRIFLFSKAKGIMEEEGADFIFTGEVLGERPMSQRRDAMNRIDTESGLKRKVLRPLSAKLLEPTTAEEKGLVDRSKLLDIRGRSRKPQLALARKYQILDFPTPAGGCLLTDRGFSLKVKESFAHGEDSIRHMTLLKVGRHFRAPSGVKIIAGRDQEENEVLMNLSLPSEPKLTVHGHKSTYALLLGESDPQSETLAAGICARYSDGRRSQSVPVRIWLTSPSQFRLVEASPIEDSLLSHLRVGE
jgi:tRNA-specific 2-thiouridylase